MPKREKGERSLIAGKRKPLHQEQKERVEQEQGERCRRNSVGICSAYRKQQLKKQEAVVIRAKMELETNAELNVYKCRVCRWYHIGGKNERYNQDWSKRDGQREAPKDDRADPRE